MWEPTREEKDDSLANFIDATNNHATTMIPCGSCARELLINDTTVIDIDSIPHKEHLEPATPHPSHTLISDLLLYEPALKREKTSVAICNECLSALKKDK